MSHKTYTNRYLQGEERETAEHKLKILKREFKHIIGKLIYFDDIQQSNLYHHPFSVSAPNLPTSAPTIIAINNTNPFLRRPSEPAIPSVSFSVPTYSINQQNTQMYSSNQYEYQ